MALASAMALFGLILCYYPLSTNKSLERG